MEIVFKMAARRCWLAVVLTATMLPAFAATVDDGLQRVTQIKAAFVLNIARFVAWPPESATAGKKIRLCFFRDDILAGAKQSLTRNPVAGRAVHTRKIQRLDGADDCDIVLIPGSQVQRFVSESSVTVERPILTIVDLTAADEVGRAYPGVHVNLIRRGNSIGLEINVEAVNRAGLQVSSSLLMLARIVGGRM